MKKKNLGMAYIYKLGARRESAVEKELQKLKLEQRTSDKFLINFKSIKNLVDV